MISTASPLNAAGATSTNTSAVSNTPRSVSWLCRRVTDRPGAACGEGARARLR